MNGFQMTSPFDSVYMKTIYIDISKMCVFELYIGAENLLRSLPSGQGLVLVLTASHYCFLHVIYMYVTFKSNV